MCVPRRTVDQHVADTAFVVERESYGKARVHGVADSFHGLGELTGVVVINELPPAVSNAAQRRARTIRIEPITQELPPAIRRDLIERVHHVVKRVSNDFGWRISAAVKDSAKIIE